MKPLLLDSCVYLSYFLENETHSKESRKFMKWIKDHRVQVVLFRMVYFEVANVLMKKCDLPFDEVFSNYIGSMMLQAQDQVIELDQRFDDYFYELYEHQVQLKTMDALVYLAAYHNGAILVSWDKQFVREASHIWEAFTPTQFLDHHS